VMAKLIDDMLAHIRTGRALLPSRIDGHVAQGSIYGTPGTVIEFHQSHRLPGSSAATETTSLVPFVDDPTLDSEATHQVSTGDFGGVLVSAFNDVTGVGPYVSGPIAHPRMVCRLGSYFDEPDTDVGFTPFPDLLAVWGSYGHYQACVSRATNALVEA